MFSAILPSKEEKVTQGQGPVQNKTEPSDKCCACPKSPDKIKEEEMERQIEIEFENYLHDHVYCKRYDGGQGAKQLDQ
jgi:hypothetical protein